MKNIKGNKRSNLVKVGFGQATVMMAYVALITFILMNAEKVFGKMDGFIGPLLVISLFSTSALISALITLGLPDNFNLR